MPVQASTVFPTGAGTHTEVQPLLSLNQFQSTPGTGQSLNSTNDKLSIDSSAELKPVIISKFAGNKKHYEIWKAAFYSCVDRARAAPEYKLLGLRECLQGEPSKLFRILDILRQLMKPPSLDFNGSMVGNVQLSRFVSKNKKPSNR